MDIKTILDEFILSEIAEDAEECERKRRLSCELVLNEFKKMTADDLSKYLKDAIICKTGPSFDLTFSFPVTFNPSS
ncbi:hypothetical protein [Paenibacillus sp. DRB1-1]|uniref:hypothetical protein n=1 Tax=Paenibacillus sp. DRB1-1 TaxID=3422309 RepID=UPI003F94A8B0